MLLYRIISIARYAVPIRLTVDSEMYNLPGTWQVPPKEVVRVLGISRRDIRAPFVYHSTLCLWRWTHEDVLLLG